MQAIEAYGRTDVGKVRAQNEDSMCIDIVNNIYIVADGMGGHSDGEVASRYATEVVRASLASQIQDFSDLGRAATPAARTKATAAVERAIQKACAELFHMGQKDPTHRGMGTTVVCLVVTGNKGVVGHVGDSRVYQVRNSQAHLLTEDHNLINAQIKAGVMSKDEALRSNLRNVVTRAVGIQESVQVDTLVVDVVPGDRYVLCSDGLHGYTSDEKLAEIVDGTPVDAIAETLVNFANERGGKDNITAVVVAFPSDVPGASDSIADVESQMEALQRIPLFRHLNYKEQVAVLSAAITRNFAANMDIVSENMPGDELFVIVRGKVSVSKAGVELAELSAGGHFGEMGLVDAVPRSATVRSKQETRLVVLSREAVMELMRRDTHIAVKLLWNFVQVLSDRLRSANIDLSNSRQELAMQQQSSLVTGE